MAEAGAWSSTCASRPLVRKSPPSLSSSRGHFYLAPNGPFTWWRHDLDAGCTCTDQCLPSPQLAQRRALYRPPYFLVVETSVENDIYLCSRKEGGSKGASESGGQEDRGEEASEESRQGSRSSSGHCPVGSLKRPPCQILSQAWIRNSGKTGAMTSPCRVNLIPRLLTGLRPAPSSASGCLRASRSIAQDGR